MLSGWTILLLKKKASVTSKVKKKIGLPDLSATVKLTDFGMSIIRERNVRSGVMFSLVRDVEREKSLEVVIRSCNPLSIQSTWLKYPAGKVKGQRSKRKCTAHSSSVSSGGRLKPPPTVRLGDHWGSLGCSCHSNLKSTSNNISRAVLKSVSNLHLRTPQKKSNLWFKCAVFQQCADSQQWISTKWKLLEENS